MVPAFYRYLLPKCIPVLGAGLRVVTYLNNSWVKNPSNLASFHIINYLFIVPKLLCKLLKFIVNWLSLCKFRIRMILLLLFLTNLNFTTFQYLLEILIFFIIKRERIKLTLMPIKFQKLIN